MGSSLPIPCPLRALVKNIGIHLARGNLCFTLLIQRGLSMPRSVLFTQIRRPLPISQALVARRRSWVVGYSIPSSTRTTTSALPTLFHERRVL